MECQMTVVNGTILVNKSHPLPGSYNPGLNKEAMKAYELMKIEGEKQGFKLKIVSGFRSYCYQEKIYKEYVKEYGEKKANTFSAKPGYSEHQTGLALDIGEDSDAYALTKESDWLKENAYKFGFVIRYPKGKESITGYKYEPWHIRYVGKIHAKNMYIKGITLEEYLKIN